jgi:hypothetical protein
VEAIQWKENMAKKKEAADLKKIGVASPDPKAVDRSTTLLMREQQQIEQA